MTLSEALNVKGTTLILDEEKREFIVANCAGAAIYAAPIRQVLEKLTGREVRSGGSEYIPLSKWAELNNMASVTARGHFANGRFGEEAYLDESYPPRGRIMVKHDAPNPARRWT
jgi:arylamine N-acetyltransferase